jgi:cardiolipin synthase
MSIPANLLERISDFATSVSPEAVGEVARQLRSVSPSASSDILFLNIQRQLQSSAREVFQKMVGEWQQTASVCSILEFAAAIEGALYHARRIRMQTTTELVWTGPTFPSAGLRSTEQVLLDLIRSAKLTLFIVTFAAYKIQSLVDALNDAIQRGVRIVFVLESHDDSNGKVSFDPALALTSFGAMKAAVYVWPLEKRLQNSKGQHGSLHAKFVVADQANLFISSANLTEYALNLNIELGVLIRGGDAPHLAEINIVELIQRGVLCPL